MKVFLSGVHRENLVLISMGQMQLSQFDRVY